MADLPEIAIPAVALFVDEVAAGFFLCINDKTVMATEFASIGFDFYKLANRFYLILEKQRFAEYCQEQEK